MSNQLWSWVLAGVGLAGLYLAGRKNARGWLIGMAAQVLWLIYAVVTRQWGFIFTAVAYAAMYYNNWTKWIRENRDPQTHEENV